jgi:nitroreductase
MKEGAQMDFEELIHARQSCRNFSGEEIPREEILACLEAARLAPSARNSQPFHITVCTGEAAKTAGARTRLFGANGFTEKVPCFLLFSERNADLLGGLAHVLKFGDYRSIDIGIAVGMLTLAAKARGLDTCILGIFDEKGLKKNFGIREPIRLVVALGRAAEGDPLRTKKRRKTEEMADFIER